MCVCMLKCVQFVGGESQTVGQKQGSAALIWAKLHINLIGWRIITYWWKVKKTKKGEKLTKMGEGVWGCGEPRDILLFATSVRKTEIYEKLVLPSFSCLLLPVFISVSLTQPHKHMLLHSLFHFTRHGGKLTWPWRRAACQWRGRGVSPGFEGLSLAGFEHDPGIGGLDIQPGRPGQGDLTLG